MKLYSENNNYKLYYGDMLDMLKVIEPNTIDSIITDPPYGLTSITKRFGKEDSVPAQYGKDGSFSRLSKGFMGKEWDGSGIEYNIGAWEKCYEVLKPGGYLLAFGGSRTFHRIACAIEDAGFEIRDTIMWLYGSGFPKSMDISKQIDKKGGNDYSKQFAKDLKQARENKNLTLKYCDDKYCNGSTNWSWYEGRKDGCRVPDYNIYLEIVKEFPELEKYREIIKEAEREVIGKQKYTNDKNIMNISNYSSERIHLDITEPATNLAKQWQGWGTALKPSFEPIIVARKPFKGSLVDNIIENGVGGINIDECRVALKDNEVKKVGFGNAKTEFNKGIGNSGDDNYKCEWQKDTNGRFPANTILTYDINDYDEVCGCFPYTNSGKMKLNSEVKRKGITNDMPVFNNKNCGIDVNKSTGLCSFGDSGSASRYFYCAKASTKDRNEGLDNFKNTHPTVKPTNLMQYLIRLVTPSGGTILDPFNGSGSTGKAVMYENKERNKNYKYVGIELTEEYLPISKARIEYVCNLIDDEEKKDKQLTIFDLESEV